MKINRLSDQVSPVSEYGIRNRYSKTLLKQILLLALALFLMSAPAPDSQDVTEMTANFIITLQHSETPSFNDGE
jgi:hypothetical protein